MQTEKHSITSICGEYTRDVWLLRSPVEGGERLAIFLDGELYLRNMNCIPVIQELVESEGIPPLTCLFVSHVDGAARHRDFTGSNTYARFIAEDVVAWAHDRCDNLHHSGRLICGLSLSGLAAVSTALNYPDLFSSVLAQSGSFWWTEGRERSWPRTSARFWLSVGDEETATGISHPPSGLYQRVSQIEGVENAVQALKTLGATVRFEPYTGGHAIEPWRNELAPALKWLIGASPALGETEIRNPESSSGSPGK